MASTAMNRALAWLLVALALVAGAAAQTLPLEPETEQDPALKNALRVTGVVRGPTGPAEGVQILLELSDMRIRRQVAFLQARTDSAGMFEIDLSAHDMPRYGLQFNTSSVRYMETRRILQHDRADFPVHIELEVQPGTVARGTVKDDEGNPLEGVFISAPDVRGAQSDAHGNWEVFGLPPHGATLLFRKEGQTEQSVAVQSDGPGVVEGLEVVMPSATRFAGKVVDGGGNAVEFPLVYFVAGERYLQVVGDKEGSFLFKGVPETIVDARLTAMAKGFLPTDHDVTADEAAKFEATVAMDAGVFFEGKALLPDGTPAPGAIVVAGPTFAPSVPQAPAGSDGTWTLGPFPPLSQQVLTVLPPSPEPLWGVADLVLKSTGKPGQFEGDVELWPKGFSSDFTAAFANGRVTMDRRDEGVGGLSGPVKYSGAWDGVANEFKGTMEVVGFAQTGEFTMRRSRVAGEGLAGEWELREEIGPSQLDLAPRQIAFRAPAIAGCMTVDLHLDKGLTLSGTVLRADGKPFIDGTVHVSDWEGTSVYRPTAEIGAGGKFELRRLPQGTFLVQAISRDETNATFEVVARGGVAGIVLREGEPDVDPMDE